MFLVITLQRYEKLSTKQNNSHKKSHPTKSSGYFRVLANS